MQTEKKTIGTILLQIALGLLFIVGGIWTLQNGKGDEIAAAIQSIFDGDAEKIFTIVFGIIEIVAGIFLLLRLFCPIGTNLDTVLMIVIMICWVVCIVMTDFLGNSGLFKNMDRNFLAWLNRFARHLLVLGAIIKVRE